MRLYVWKNKGAGPDYTVTQKQKNDDEQDKELQVGIGFKNEAPDGSHYITLTINNHGKRK